jgi:hypothetical protein
MKRVEIQENPFPKGCRPWGMSLTRDEENCQIFIRGNGGGTKACFIVQFADLVAAVNKLGETDWPCRYCDHMKKLSKGREKFVGGCEYSLVPDTCGKFELAKCYEGHDPREK